MHPSDFRRLALTMPHAVESAHMGHPDFRVRNRVFASLYRQEKNLAMVKLTPQQQKRVITEHPDVFAPIPGGWGRRGATEVRLQAARAAPLKGVLMLAWRNAAPPALANDSILVSPPMFFDSPAAFRTWLKKHHARAQEVIVGFHKRHTTTPCMTWPQSVAEALCFGWIDGIRRRLDDDRYTIRFTPRRPRSAWSAINIRMFGELEAAGRMTAAGRAAFAARPHKSGPQSGGYSYERRNAEFDDARRMTFQRNKAAWRFFLSQPPGYRRTATWWVMSAKRDDTRSRRLSALMTASAAKTRLNQNL